jgi:hypothetical protein
MEMAPVREERRKQKTFPSLPTLAWKARKNRELPTFPQLRRRLGISFFPQARLTSTSTKSVTYMPGTFCYRHARSHNKAYFFSSLLGTTEHHLTPFGRESAKILTCVVSPSPHAFAAFLKWE